MNKLFCFIPAKAASTRLKKKNILPLDDKALLFYPIHNAQHSELFAAKDVIVSSESEEVQQIARQYGANVPYTRSAYLAKDPYGVVDVVLDFLERFPTYQAYDACCILLPTSPLMLPKDIKASFEVFSGGFNSVMSVTPTAHNAYRSVLVKEDHIKAVFPEHIRKKSQELMPTYRINGAVIWIDVKAFLEHKSYFMQPWGAYKMPINRSVDIDNQEDYDYAQFLMQKRKQHEN